jgi:hypothetical protein
MSIIGILGRVVPRHPFDKPRAYGTAKKTGRRWISYTVELEVPNDELCKALVKALEEEHKPDKHEYNISLITPYGEEKPFQYVSGHMFFWIVGIGGPALTEWMWAKTAEVRQTIRRVVTEHGYRWVRWR